jgi:hypothetical protein
MKLKTRSSLYLRQLNDDVKKALDKKSIELGIAKWLIIESILEKALNIKSSTEMIDFLGTSKTRARTGKPVKKQLTK